MRGTVNVILDIRVSFAKPMLMNAPRILVGPLVHVWIKSMLFIVTVMWDIRVYIVKPTSMNALPILAKAQVPIHVWMK